MHDTMPLSIHLINTRVLNTQFGVTVVMYHSRTLRYPHTLQLTDEEIRGKTGSSL